MYQSDILLLANVFENFTNMCLKIYELDSLKFLSGPGLAWQAALKKTKVKVDLLTNINMLLTSNKGIRGGIHYSIFQYTKTNNKYKIIIKIKHRHIFNTGMEIIYMDVQCHKSFQ